MVTTQDLLQKALFGHRKHGAVLKGSSVRCAKCRAVYSAHPKALALTLMVDGRFRNPGIASLNDPRLIDPDRSREDAAMSTMVLLAPSFKVKYVNAAYGGSSVEMEGVGGRKVHVRSYDATRDGDEHDPHFETDLDIADALLDALTDLRSDRGWTLECVSDEWKTYIEGQVGQRASHV